MVLPICKIYFATATMHFFSQTMMKTQQRQNLRNLFRNHQFTINRVPCKTTVKQSSIKCRVTDQWDNLPGSVLRASSDNSFKR